MVQISFIRSCALVAVLALLPWTAIGAADIDDWVSQVADASPARIATVDGAPSVDLQLDLASPVVASAGQNIQVSATVSNLSSLSSVSDPLLVIDLPANPPGGFVSFVGNTNPDWSCTSPMATNQVICTYVRATPLAALGSSTLGIDVRLPVFAPLEGVGTPFAFAGNVSSSSISDPNPSNNADSTTTLVTARPSSDIAVTMTATSPTTLNIGGTATGSIQIAANPIIPAGANTRVDLVVPASADDVTLTKVSNIVCSSPEGVRGGSVFSCDVVGYPATVNFSADLPQSGNQSFSATYANCDCNDSNPGNNAATLTYTVLGPPQPEFEISSSVLPAQPNQDFNLLFTSRNSGASPDSDFRFTALLPAPLVLTAPATGGGYSCTSGAVGGGLELVCDRTGSPVAAGAVLTVTAPVRVNSQSPPSSVLITGSLQSAATPNGISDSLNLPIETNLSFQLTKTDSVDPVEIGAEFEYRIDLRNTGNIVAGAPLVLEDSLPSSIEFIAFSQVPSDWSCNFAEGTVFCTGAGAALTPGNGRNFSFRVRGTQVGTVVNEVVLFEEIQLGGGERGKVLASASTSTTIVERGPVEVDLALIKSASVERIAPGGSFSYRIEVLNQTSESASGVEVTDQVPPELNVVRVASTSNLACTLSGNAIRCTGSQPAQGRDTITLDVTLNAGFTGTAVSNTAMVNLINPDPNPQNNSSTAVVAVDQQITPPPPTEIRADLRLQASTTPQVAGLNSTVQIAICLFNDGPAPTVPAGAVIEAQLPAELSGVNAVAPGFGCAITGTTVRCTRNAALDLGCNAVNISARTPASEIDGSAKARTTLTTTVRVVELPPLVIDSNIANNVVQSTLELERPDDPPPPPPPASADLVMTVAGTGESAVEVGQLTSFRATVRNAGPSAADGIAVVFDASGGATDLRVTGNGINCSGTNPQRCELSGMLAANGQVDLTAELRAPDDLGEIRLAANVTAQTADPAPANNAASAGKQVTRPEELGATIQPFADPNDRGQRAVVGPVERACNRDNAPFPELCDQLFDASRRGDADGIQSVLRAFSPEETLAQSRAVNEIGIAQFQNIDARIAELRGGGGAFSAAGFTGTFGNESIPFGMLIALLNQDEAEDVSGGGGADGLVSPWGFFINGSFGAGDRGFSDTERELDFETRGLTAGVDYRFSDSLVAGIALGWSKFDSELDNLSRLDTKAWTLTGYVSYYPQERWYLDGRLSLGRAGFEADRRVRFQIRDLSFDEIAEGDTNADQLTAVLGSGYHFQVQRFSITPNLSLRYLSSDVDAYTETGAGVYSLEYAEQSIESLTLQGGMAVSRPISTARGILTPQFDLSLHRELMDDPMQIEARLIGAPDDELFFLRGDEVDQNYGSYSVGLVWLTSGGRQVYVTYRSLFGLDQVDRYTVNIGGRFEF